MLWVEVLNAATRWVDYDAAREWLNGRDPASRLKAAEHLRVVRDQAVLRRIFCAQHLQRDLPDDDVNQVNAWLSAARLQWPGGPSGSLVANAERQVPPAFSEALTSSLVQLQAFLEEPQFVQRAQRCHGIRRGPAVDLGIPEPWERQFQQRADVLPGLLGGEYHLCPQILFTSRGGRFCSKSCSNASFAIRKAASEPHYFADKQSRYRKRLKKESTPRRDSFMFLD